MRREEKKERKRKSEEERKFCRKKEHFILILVFFSSLFHLRVILFLLLSFFFFFLLLSFHLSSTSFSYLLDFFSLICFSLLIRNTFNCLSSLTLFSPSYFPGSSFFLSDSVPISIVYFLYFFSCSKACRIEH